MRSFATLFLLVSLNPCFCQAVSREYLDNADQAVSPDKSVYYYVGKKNKQGYFYDSLRSYYSETNTIRSVGIRDKFGNPAGNFESFYPNGALKMRGRYEKKYFKIFQSSADSTEFNMEQFNDPRGIEQVKNSNGFVDGRIDRYRVKGKIVNGLKDSIWTTFDDDGKIRYHESWQAGELIDGISYDANGKEYYYKSELVPPEPSEGVNGFYERMSDEVNYPKEAQQRGIAGKIIIEFVVEKNGAITRARVVKGLGFGCDEEALRVLSLSKPWRPALERGQKVSFRTTIPFLFTLK